MRYQFLLITLLFAFESCQPTPETGSPEYISKVTHQIDDEALVQADGATGDWITHGLNYSEDRYSQLSQINLGNIDSLGLVWTVELGTRRGIEATPLVVDGIMYLTGPWSKLYAVNTRTGKLIWEYNPQVPGRFGPKACCDVVNRGAALYQGDVFIGTIDGRLISVDAATGAPNWEVYTVDTTNYYTITGAPRIVKGKVIIGNGGAEYGVRGYISAYDATTGELSWRFYTVPGDPAEPAENTAMEKALETWNGEWWKYGGGGTVWDAMAYDPELNLLYIGTGNGSPWSQQYRSPGGGDNLYLSSILALNPDEGSLVWYYQTTPGDSWDFTATQHMILADLSLDGENRKVLMQAPKNGFFYVLDRETGELISAEPYVYVNWATHVDLETGRPVETDFSRYDKFNAVISPNYHGGHNWQPMAYSPETGLVYIPAMRNSHLYGTNPTWEFGKSGYSVSTGWNTGTGFDPSKPVRYDSLAPASSSGMLMAWDPVANEIRWLVEHKYRWNAGVLATAGGLVFQGNAEGNIVAYSADSGDLLWQSSVGSGSIASPITYLVDGKQYVSLAVGWGGASGQTTKITDQVYPGTIYTFAIGGNASPPVYPDPPPKRLIDRGVTVEGSLLESGGNLYSQNCSRCHGRVGGGGGALPDLAYSSERIHDNFLYIVKGSFESLGMPDFTGKLTDEDIGLIQQYIYSAAKNQALNN